MNGQPILTDTLVERMLAGRAGKGVPLGLAEAISAQAALTPQARRRWWARDVAPRPQASALQLVWIVALVGLLAVATVGAAMVGSLLLNPPPNVPQVPPLPTATPTATPSPTTQLTVTGAPPESQWPFREVICGAEKLGWPDIGTWAQLTIEVRDLQAMTGLDLVLGLHISNLAGTSTGTGNQVLRTAIDTSPFSTTLSACQVPSGDYVLWVFAGAPECRMAWGPICGLPAPEDQWVEPDYECRLEFNLQPGDDSRVVIRGLPERGSQYDSPTCSLGDGQPMSP